MSAPQCGAQARGALHGSAHRAGDQLRAGVDHHAFLGARNRRKRGFEILRCIDRDAFRAAGRLNHQDRNPVLDRAQLFEAFDLLERRDRQARKGSQTITRVRVNADVVI